MITPPASPNRFGGVLKRGLVGGMAGSVIALMGVSFILEAMRHYPEDATLGSAVLGSGFVIGALLGAFGGTLEIRGLAKDTSVGGIVGALVGIASAVIYGQIAATLCGASAGFYGKLAAGYQNQGLLVGVPAGAVLGCVIGFVRGASACHKPEVTTADDDAEVGSTAPIDPTLLPRPKL